MRKWKAKKLKQLVLAADMQEKLMFTPVNVSNYFWTQRVDTPCLVPSNFYDEQTLESLPWISSLPFNLKKDFANGQDPVFMRGSRHSRYCGYFEKSKMTGLFLDKLFARYVRLDKKTIWFKKDWLAYKLSVERKLRDHVEKHHLYVHSNTWRSMSFKPCEEGEDYGSLSIIGIDQPTYLMPSVLVNGKVVRVNTNDEESVIDYDKRVDAIKKLIAIDEKISTLTI
jgi:hypothetical protein